MTEKRSILGDVSLAQGKDLAGDGFSLLDRSCTRVDPVIDEKERGDQAATISRKLVLELLELSDIGNRCCQHLVSLHELANGAVDLIKGHRTTSRGARAGLFDAVQA